MKAIVVYESHWGNTAAIAQAIADGIGSGTRALNTDEATREALAGVDLIVAGSPVIAFALPRDGSLNQIAKDEKARFRRTPRIRCCGPGSTTCQWVTGSPPLRDRRRRRAGVRRRRRLA
jgi:hypothetical protein